MIYVSFQMDPLLINFCYMGSLIIQLQGRMRGKIG